ncbi:MAG TPA: mechanosensitive ion channel domain-containing protein [Dissulfurispiraceae bacterium]|nr:mechanosensitive ion channel domain-containing protein [Dissulfurispiraceae bacterium]
MDQKKESSLVPGQLVLPGKDEEIDASISKLEKRLSDVRTQTASLLDESSQRTGLFVAPPEDLRKRQRLLSELAASLDKHSQALRDLKEIRRINKERTVEIRNWQGFQEKPPYSISFLDDLRDAATNQRLDVQSLTLKLTAATGELGQYVKALQESKKALRLAQEQFERSAGSAKETQRRWQRDLLSLENEVNEASVSSLETRRLVYEESLGDKKEYIQFLDQKLRMAEEVSPLTRQDVDQKLHDLEAQRKQVTAELSLALRREDDAKKRLNAARDKVVPISSQAVPEMQRDSGKGLDVMRTQAELALLQAQAETASDRVEVLKGILQLIDISETGWEDRFWLTQQQDLSAIRDKNERVGHVMESIRIWKNYVQSRILNLGGLLQAQKARFDQADRSRVADEIDRNILKSMEERQSLLLRALDMLSSAERVITALHDGLRERQGRASFGSRLQEAYQWAVHLLKKLWAAELYIAEETVVAEGTKVVKPVSVTVAKVVQALIILIVGIWIARKLMRPLRWLVIHRFRQDRSIAAQICTVAFLFLFVMVFVFSLVSVNIPLAVFAFLGGALAIGVGFGAQNLINNFISGLILLFDRSITVGDIIEVDGQGGKVTTIGMRSSHVVRFDGVEMLVPNSQFLQQKVINWTHSERQMRYQISVGVAYGSPTKKVAELLMQSVAEQQVVMKTPAPMVVFEDFGESSLNFMLYFWLELESVRDNRLLLSDIRHRITELFEAEQIVLSFPQRDVHLDAAAPIPIRLIPAPKD